MESPFMIDGSAVAGGEMRHVLTVGCRCRDCPAEYGPTTKAYNRFNRRSRQVFWVKLLDALADAGR